MEFCDHLDEYGVLFGRAQSSYQNCLNLVDQLLANPEDSRLKTTLEKALDEWVLETRNLRAEFSRLVKKGAIKVVAEKKPGSPVASLSPVPRCSGCGFEVPRLVFSEFQLDADRNPTFRGQGFPTPELV